MMTKTQSRKMNQLKYLVLIPVLMSMLFYSACSENETLNNQVSKKEKFKVFTLIDNGTLKIFETEKESYLDIFMGDKIPSEFEEIAKDNLTQEEKIEYTSLKSLLATLLNNDFKQVKFFKLKSGRKVIGAIFKNLKDKDDVRIIQEVEEVQEVGEVMEVEEIIEEVSFMNIEKVPVFPGCEEGDKDCFSKKIQEHFSKNFDADLPKTLGLKSGMKKVFIGFKIDENGNIVDIHVKAPHKEIENEVNKVISSLPKMTPGEYDGKAVAVRYSIPFTIVVE